MQRPKDIWRKAVKLLDFGSRIDFAIRILLLWQVGFGAMVGSALTLYIYYQSLPAWLAALIMLFGVTGATVLIIHLVSLCWPKKEVKHIQDKETQEAPEKSKTTKIPQISDKAKTLLIEASHDTNGIVMKTEIFGGLYVKTNGKKLNEQGNPRSEAEWEAALNELCEMGYLQREGHEGILFKMTHEGYRIADILDNITPYAEKELHKELNLDIRIPNIVKIRSGVFDQYYAKNRKIVDVHKTEWMIVLNDVCITNLSKTNSVSLDFVLTVKLQKKIQQHDDIVLHSLKRDQFKGFWKPIERFMSGPLEIESQKPKLGKIGFFVIFAKEYGGIDNFNCLQANLKIKDTVSGQEIDMKVPGNYRSP